jgi:transcriptional regulator with XRE-family HTH domain
MASQTRTLTPTPLATFVRERLNELDIKQSDFCRLSMFDQGLLSKIQNSVVTSLSLESVLKLAIGLSVQPKTIFNLLDRMDMHDLVMKCYASEFSEFVGGALKDKNPGVAAEAQRVLSEAAARPIADSAKSRRRRWQEESRETPMSTSPSIQSAEANNVSALNGKAVKGSLSSNFNGVESGS